MRSVIPPVSQPAYWANYIGRGTELVSASRLASIAGTAQIASHGVQVGADVLVGKRTVLGAMFNYEHSVDKLNTSRMFGDNYAFSIYGAHQFGYGFDGFALVGYGHQSYSSWRWDPMYDEFYGAKFSGNTVEATLEVGRRFRLYQSLWLRPAVAFDISNNDVNNFTESSGTDPLVFGNMSLTQSFFRIGSDAIVRRGNASGTCGLYYSYQMSQHGDRVRGFVATTDGTNSAILRGSYLGRNKVTFNIGGSYVLDDLIEGIMKRCHKKRCSEISAPCAGIVAAPGKVPGALSVYGGYSGDLYADRAGTPWGHNGYAGMRWAF